MPLSNVVLTVKPTSLSVGMQLHSMSSYLNHELIESYRQVSRIKSTSSQFNMNLMGESSFYELISLTLK